MPNPNEEIENLSAGQIVSAILNDPGSVPDEVDDPEATTDGSDAAEATAEALAGNVEGADQDTTSVEGGETEGAGADGEGAPAPEGEAASEAEGVEPPVSDEGEEAVEPVEKKQPALRSRPPAVRGPSREEIELDAREDAYLRKQEEFAARIKAKQDAGDEYDEFVDGRAERELLREGQAIMVARNRLHRQKLAEFEQERVVKQTWEAFEYDTRGLIKADEGRNKFLDLMAEAAKEYGPDAGSDPNNPTFNGARWVATDRFNTWVKTVGGQRDAKLKTSVKKGAAPPQTKAGGVPGKPKTPITQGGGRVTIPPVAGKQGRPPEPIPKTYDEKVDRFARTAGMSPIEALMGG